MAKVVTQARETYENMSQTYKDAIKKLNEKEKATILEIKKDSTTASYKKLQLVTDMMNIASQYIVINNLSQDILNTKNNDALNDARKALYKAIIYLEEIVSSIVDAPYSEYEERLAQIANTSVVERYYMVRKLGLSIQLVKDAFGDNSKWKMSFVELQSRYAVVSKNLMNMKLVGKGYFDPNIQDYDTIVMYARLVRKLLDDSATEYRDKYELASRRIDDIRNAINLLLAERRLLILIGEKDDAEEIKKKALVWKERMDADQKAGRSN